MIYRHCRRCCHCRPRRYNNNGFLFLQLLIFFSTISSVSSSSSSSSSSSLLEDKIIEIEPPLPSTLSFLEEPDERGRSRVLPPIPDDEPEICKPSSSQSHNNTTSSDNNGGCGKERYCSYFHKKNNFTSSSYYYCLHKTFWFPTLNDLFAMIVIGTCAFVAAMGGIGGGGLILPILILITNFTAKEASVISNSCVFGNGLGQFIINNFIYNKNNSSKNNSHFVTGTVLMILPGLLVGGSIAIIVEKLIPSTLILILAFFTLNMATIKTYFKAQKISKSSSKTRNNNVQEEEGEELISSVDEGTDDDDDNGNDKIEDEVSLLSRHTDLVHRLNEELFFPNETTTSSRVEYQSFFHSSISNNTSDDDSDTGEEKKEDDAGEEILTNSGVVTYDDDIENNIIRYSSKRCSISRQILIWWSKYSIEILIVACWVLDAFTFMALKGGSGGHFSFVHKCTTSWYVVLCLPTIIGVVFVLVGRKQLFKYHNNTDDNTNNQSNDINNIDKEATTTSQPLLFSSQLSPPSSATPLLSEPSSSSASLLEQQGGLVEISPIKTIVESGDEFDITTNNDVKEDEDFTSSNTDSNNNDKEFDNLVWWLPIISVGIGFVCALLGIGGGELLGPILLIINMNPIYSSTTTATLSVLNSGTNILHYLLNGYIFMAPSYNIIYSFVSCVGGIMGRTFVISMNNNKKNGNNTNSKSSSAADITIAYSLFIVLFIATLLITYELVTKPISWEIQGVC